MRAASRRTTSTAQPRATSSSADRAGGLLGRVHRRRRRARDELRRHAGPVVRRRGRPSARSPSSTRSATSSASASRPASPSPRSPSPSARRTSSTPRSPSRRRRARARAARTAKPAKEPKAEKPAGKAEGGDRGPGQARAPARRARPGVPARRQGAHGLRADDAPRRPPALLRRHADGVRARRAEPVHAPRAEPVPQDAAAHARGRGAAARRPRAARASRPTPAENTALVRVGAEDTIVLLLVGGQLHHYEMMQSVTAFDGPDTICSRVLLQQDVQGVGTVHNVIVMAEERERELVQGFAAFYPEARVETLREGMARLGLVGPYGPLAPSLVEATGAALAGHLRPGKGSPFEDANLLPEALRRATRKFSLAFAWHTLVVAVLLFMSVLYFMYTYTQQKEAHRRRPAAPRRVPARDADVRARAPGPHRQPQHAQGRAHGQPRRAGLAADRHRPLDADAAPHDAGRGADGRRVDRGDDAQRRRAPAPRLRHDARSRRRAGAAARRDHQRGHVPGAPRDPGLRVPDDAGAAARAAAGRPSDARGGRRDAARRRPRCRWPASRAAAPARRRRPPPGARAGSRRGRPAPPPAAAPAPPAAEPRRAPDAEPRRSRVSAPAPDPGHPTPTCPTRRSTPSSSPSSSPPPSARGTT